MQLSDNMRGALYMSMAMAAFTANDAAMKGLADDVGVWQTMFLRGIATTLILAALTVAMGQFRLRQSARDWRLMMLRAAAEAAGAWLFITALFHMDIANLSAILQSLPLTVTLAGALFFGEAVGWRRMLAILVGFGGVLLIVKPGGADFNVYSIYGLLTVLCVTVRDLCARRISSAVPSLLISLAAAFVVTAAAGVGVAFEPWRAVGTAEAGLLALATMMVIGGYIFSVSAMRVGEIGFVAPFRYTSLIVAMVLGAVFFGTFPDALRLLGAGIVVGTGLFTLWREWELRRAGRRGVPVPQPPRG